MYRIGLYGMNYSAGGEFENSGEKMVLQKVDTWLRPEKDIVVFDVGANLGEFSNEAVQFFKGQNLQVFTFEPSLKTYQKLNDNLNDARIKTFNIGLGNKNETVTLYKSDELAGSNSIYNRRMEHLDVKMDLKEEIKIEKLDDFSKANHINKINFLKLDVEGHEFFVLEGAKEMISQNKIQFIQFEFGGTHIDSRIFFQDYWYLLNGQFDIYRILLDGIEPIKKYEEFNEIFTTVNYLAILKQDKNHNNIAN